jgi:hypothetical protein
MPPDGNSIRHRAGKGAADSAPHGGIIGYDFLYFQYIILFQYYFSQGNSGSTDRFGAGSACSFKRTSRAVGD